MAHTDTIADMLTRIRNASAVKKAEVILPYSKIKEAISKILREEGYIDGLEVIPASEGIQYQQIKLNLKYDDKTPAIKELKRISKPGRRVYKSKDELPVVLNDYGIAIVSTSRGLMTNRQARKEGVGGEIICEVS